MNKRTENIVGAFVAFGLISHIVGYFFWPLIKWVNIYYISIYFLMMNCGLMFMLISKGIIMKYVSTGMFAIGGQFLYMEVAGDPQNWTTVNIWTLGFIFANSLLISYFINRYKKNHNYG